MSDKTTLRDRQLIVASGAVTILAVFVSSRFLEQQPLGSGTWLGLALLPLPFLLRVPALLYSYWRYR